MDLLPQTGGEQRLSDSLLWECAYAELYFMDRRSPDVDAPPLTRALATITGVSGGSAACLVRHR